jgi:putative tryptophan/tyrosine transport system substrate-binding protein
VVVAGFRKGLREAGFIEGENAVIAFRWAEGHYERLPALASDLIAVRVAVLFAAGGPPFRTGGKSSDVDHSYHLPGRRRPGPPGFVASLNRPGGNVTGVLTLGPDLASKLLEILREMLPQAATVALLVNPANPVTESIMKDARAAASLLRVRLELLNASTVSELEEAFSTIPKLRADALAVTGEPFFERTVALSRQHGIAGCYPWREYVLAGGLMSYGASLPDAYRQAAVYVGRVLKGEKPADLPVMQPTKFELALNLKTAKTLGLIVPPMLLARADEVIE